MNVVVTDLNEICHTIIITADSGKICDIEFVRADPNEICHRTGSTTDSAEFFCKSTDPPDPSIPVLPSYELSGLPASCAVKPMTGECPKSEMI